MPPKGVGFTDPLSLLQYPELMGGNRHGESIFATPFRGWNEVLGYSMERVPARKWAAMGQPIVAHEFCKRLVC